MVRRTSKVLIYRESEEEQTKARQEDDNIEKGPPMAQWEVFKENIQPLSQGKRKS